MKFTIDRFENEYAVIEVNGNSEVMSRKLLPEGASVGDVIEIVIDRAETEKRKSEVGALFARLFRKAGK